MPLHVTETDGCVIFDVQVVPRASRDRLGPIHGDCLKVQLTAPPVDGAANEALVALVARRLGCKRADVSIVRGEGSRRKTIRVAGIARDALLHRIEGE